MERWSSISHIITETSPGFGGEQGFSREARSCICKGMNSNSEKWELYNHYGTHIDCPYHFDNLGKKMSDYSDHEWVFNSPYLIEIMATENEILRLEEERENIPAKCDILLIKSGFEQFRTEDSYWKKNPGIAPELGHWLRSNRPEIKIIGFDFISLTAYQHRETGRAAHRAFLSVSDKTEGIRIIEDMKLSSITRAPEMILVSPLMVENADGGPVNVWAKFSS